MKTHSVTACFLGWCALSLAAAAAAQGGLPELAPRTITSTKSAQEVLPYFLDADEHVAVTVACVPPALPPTLEVYRFDDLGGAPTVAEATAIASRFGFGPSPAFRPAPGAALKCSETGREMIFWSTGQYRFEDLTAADDSGLALPDEASARAFAEAWLVSVGWWDAAYEFQGIAHRLRSGTPVRATLSYARRLPSGFVTSASGAEVVLVATPGGPRIRSGRYYGTPLRPEGWAHVIPLASALNRVKQGNALFRSAETLAFDAAPVVSECRLEYSHQADRYLDPVYGLRGVGPSGPFVISVSAVASQYLTPTLEGTLNLHPETLNMGSQGRWVTARVEFPVGADGLPIPREQINLESILLNDAVFAEPQPARIGIRDGGVRSMTLKFDRAALQASLPDGGADDTVAVVLSGKVQGELFQARDSIRLVP